MVTVLAFQREDEALAVVANGKLKVSPIVAAEAHGAGSVGTKAVAFYRLAGEGGAGGVPAVKALLEIQVRKPLGPLGESLRSQSDNGESCKIDVVHSAKLNYTNKNRIYPAFQEAKCNAKAVTHHSCDRRRT